MKKILLFARAAALLMLLPLLIVSCSKDKEDSIDPSVPDDPSHDTPTPGPDNPTDQSTSDYTIIFYGHGGGSLDAQILNNIEQFYSAEGSSYDNVRIAVQYKFSTTENLANQKLSDDVIQNLGSKTVRFAIDPKNDFDKLANIGTAALAANNLDVSNPQNLTDFIDWAVENCPAKKYVLLLSTHGGGYMPHDDLPYSASLSKGMMYDDGNDGNDLTINSLKKAISDSKIHPEVIYLDACLMNSIENQFELKNLADYLVLSSYVVPGSGGDYVTLVNELAKNGDAIESTLTNFCKSTMNVWDQKNVKYADISVVRTESLDWFGNQLRIFTDKLIQAYQSGDKQLKAAIDAATGTVDLCRVDNVLPAYDLFEYLAWLCDADDDYFNDVIAEIGDYYDKCIVCQEASSYLDQNGWWADCSVMLGCKGHYSTQIWEDVKVSEDDWSTSNSVDFDSQNSVLNVLDAQGNVIRSYKYKGYCQYEADGTMKIFAAKQGEVGSEKWGSTLADTYKQLEFDKATGWSRWLEINEQEPSVISPATLQLSASGDEEGVIFGSWIVPLDTDDPGEGGEVPEEHLIMSFTATTMTIMDILNGEVVETETCQISIKDNVVTLPDGEKFTFGFDNNGKVMTVVFDDQEEFVMEKTTIGYIPIKMDEDAGKIYPKRPGASVSSRFIP